MNARAPSYLPDPDSMCYRIAEEQLCMDVEAFAGFIESASNEREPSKEFAYISTVELVAMLLNDKATDKQLSEAARELRARFIEDNQDHILSMAIKAMEN